MLSINKIVLVSTNVMKEVKLICVTFTKAHLQHREHCRSVGSSLNLCLALVLDFRESWNHLLCPSRIGNVLQQSVIGVHRIGNLEGRTDSLALCLANCSVIIIIIIIIDKLINV